MSGSPQAMFDGRLGDGKPEDTSRHGWCRLGAGMDLERDDSLDGDAPKKTPLATRIDRWLRARLGAAEPALDVGILLVAWVYLNAFVNLRWPWPEPFGLAWALPSPAVTTLLAGLCAAAWLGFRPHRAVFPILALALAPLHVVRLADDSLQAFFDRPLDPASDPALLDDLIVAVDDLVPKGELAVNLLIAAVVVGLAVFLAKQAFTAAYNVFVHPAYRYGFAAALGLLGLLTLVLPASDDGARAGAFAAPVAPRTFGVLGSLFAGGGPEQESMDALGVRQSQIQAIRPPFAGLEDADLYLFFVDSYGALLFESPHDRAMAATFRELQDNLQEAGYGIRSHRVRSPTLGGPGRYAHATLASGVRVGSEAGIDLLRDEAPRTLPRLLAGEGYATLHIMAGVARKAPREEHAYLGFSTLYRAWELGYQGPSHGWTPVPDQYALDLVYRREIERATRPLFIQYDLAGSRPPWREQAPHIDGWSDLEDGLGDGSIFEGRAAHTFPVQGLELKGAETAYRRAIERSLRVLGTYLTEVIPARLPIRKRSRRRYRPPPPLFLVLGNHPPLAQVSGRGANREVPIHVLSRDEALLAPFAERGYAEGWTLPEADDAIPMADLLVQLLEDFRAGPGATR